MSQPTPLPLSPATRSADLWREIEASVSEACVLRAEGREPEAAAILQQKLPGLIATWSRGSGLAGDRCQAMLRELFAQVQQQVATARICKRLVLQSLDPATPRTSGEERAQPMQLRRRVPIDDIPGMLDALDEGERTAALRRQNFPSPASRPRLALAAG